MTVESDEQVLSVRQASAPIKIVIYDEFGNKTSFSEDERIYFGSNPERMTFSATEDLWQNAVSLPITASQSEFYVYARGNTAGQATMTFQIGDIIASQNITIEPAFIYVIEFMTPEQTIQTNETSDAIVVQIKDIDGNPITATEDIEVDVISTSQTGELSTQKVIISAGSSIGSFTYKDTTAGEYNLQASIEDYGVSATQKITVVDAPIEPVCILITSSQVSATVGQRVPIEISLCDEDGQPTTSLQDRVIDLSSSQIIGRFYDSDSSDVAIENITIAAGQTSGSAYYTQTITGAATLTAEEENLDSSSLDLNFIAGEIASIVFTTNQQSVEKDQPSNIITIEVFDAYGNPVISENPIEINLSSTSQTGGFGLNETGPWSNGGVFTIPAGSSTASIYYKDSTPGEYRLEARLSDGVYESQAITITDSTPIPAELASLSLRGPSKVEPGTNAKYTICALDENGDVIENYVGRIVITVTPSTNNSPEYIEFTDSSNGCVEFNLIFDDEGEYTLAFESENNIHLEGKIDIVKDSNSGGNDDNGGSNGDDDIELLLPNTGWQLLDDNLISILAIVLTGSIGIIIGRKKLNKNLH